MAATMLDNNVDSAHIQIKFVTKQEQYAVPDQPLNIVGNVGKKELNELVNALIQENKISEHISIVFDFILEGEFLWTTINEHLELKQISSERVLEVEYLESVSTPHPKDCLLHDDWVSSVHALGGFILSGCYDSSANVWSETGKHLLKVPSGKGPMKAVSWISQSDDEAMFLIGGQEQVVMQWRWTRKNNTADCLAMYRGHERSIESIAVNYNGSVFASVGWDGFLKLWALNKETESGETSAKRSRRDSGGGCQTKTPMMTLKGHRDCVNCVRWTGESEVLTCSWDHTLRLWDVEEGGMKQELTGNKAFLSCDLSPKSGLILASSADKFVRLFDPRSTEGTLTKQTYSSHSLWVHAVRWSQTHEHLFMSAAQDNLVKLWDTRSPRAPLYDLSGHTDKVLCCDWSTPALLVSGGADNSVRIYSAPNED